MTALAAGRAFAELVVAGRRVRFESRGETLARLVGPLSTLADEVGPAAPDVHAREEEGDVPASVRAAAGLGAAAAGSWVEVDGSPWIVVPGVGAARVPREGALLLHGAAPALEDDSFAERVTVPALAERLRRERVVLVHAAVALREGGGAWLVPASRGGGKTTLALSLRGRGFRLLSDDRAWLHGPRAAPLVDAWPEAPRVGDGSLWLLPPHLRPGPRDEAIGKAPVRALLPPRLGRSVEVEGVAIPRLVPGRGGDAREARDAVALAALSAPGDAATAPSAASDALAFLAGLLEGRPSIEVDVGDDPARVAEAVLLAAHRARSAGA